MEAFKFNEETAARALLEAMYSTDQEVAERYGCTVAALQRWRARLRGESWFVGLVEQEHEAMRQRWLGGLEQTIGAATRAIKTIAEKVTTDPACLEAAAKNPAMLDALTRSMATLAQVRLSQQVIDARIALLRAGEDSPNGNAPGPKQIGPGIVIEAETVKS